MEIISVADKRFKKYGKVIKNIDFSSLVEEMKKTEVPEGVVYEPSVEQLESLEAAQENKNKLASNTVWILQRPHPALKCSRVSQKLRNQCCGNRRYSYSWKSLGCRGRFYIRYS